MLLIDFTEWNGVTLNGSSAYLAFIPAGSDISLVSEVEQRSRRDQFPLAGTEHHAGRDITLMILPGPAAPARAQWEEDVKKLFRSSGTFATLKGTLNTVAVQTQAKVIRVAPLDIVGFTVILTTPDPTWAYQTASGPDASSPLTIGGSHPAYPVVTYTPSGSVVRFLRFTVADETGRGVVNHFYRLGSFNASGYGVTLSSHYRVLINGVDVPFYATNWGEVDCEIFVAVSLPANGSTEVDVFFGSSINNTLTNQQLNLRGMDVSDAAWNNSTWVYPGGDAFMYALASNIQAPGAWTFGRVYGDGKQVYFPAGFGVVPLLFPAGMSAYNSNLIDAGYDGIVLTTGIELASGDALEGLSMASLTVSEGHAYLLVRFPNAPAYTTAVDVFATGGITATQDGPFNNLAGAVQIAFAPPRTDQAGNQMYIRMTSGETQVIVHLDSSKVPSQTVTSPVSYHLIDGTYTNTTTGETVTFGNVLTPSAIVVDCEHHTITPNDTLYGPITFSDDVHWLQFPTGSNAWTDAPGTTASHTWRNRVL